MKVFHQTVPHNDTTSKQGGTSGEYYHLTEDEHTLLQYLDFTKTDDGNSGTADTIDWSASPMHKSTLTGICTYTFTAPTKPTLGLHLEIVQGASAFTIVLPGTVLTPSGVAPKLSLVDEDTNVLKFDWDGTNYWLTGLGLAMS